MQFSGLEHLQVEKDAEVTCPSCLWQGERCVLICLWKRFCRLSALQRSSVRRGVSGVHGSSVPHHAPSSMVRWEGVLSLCQDTSNPLVFDHWQPGHLGRHSKHSSVKLLKKLHRRNKNFLFLTQFSVPHIPDDLVMTQLWVRAIARVSFTSGFRNWIRKLQRDKLVKKK